MPVVGSQLRIKLKAYDHRLIDRSAMEIVTTARRAGAEVVGPVPLPVKVSRYTVMRSTNIDKKSREQFETRIHKRLIIIENPTTDVVDVLMRLELPAGVYVEVKQ